MASDTSDNIKFTSESLLGKNKSPDTIACSDNNQLLDLGKRLKHIRKKLELTQETMAKCLNVSASQVSEVENGIHPPGYYFLVNICKKFNVNLYYLLFGQGSIFTEKPGVDNGMDECFVIKKEILQHFLGHFYRSPTLQHLILAHFNSILSGKKEQIEKEIREFNDKITTCDPAAGSK